MIIFYTGLALHLIPCVLFGGELVQVYFYSYARDRFATSYLPRPLVPIRDMFVYVLDSSVQFILSDKPVRRRLAWGIPGKKGGGGLVQRN